MRGEPKRCGAPWLLLLGQSAKRAVELVELVRGVDGGLGKVAKLFGKHMKLEAQRQFLESSKFRCAVGTPARIARLLDSGGLSLAELRFVVIDATWVSCGPSISRPLC